MGAGSQDVRVPLHESGVTARSQPEAQRSSMNIKKISDEEFAQIAEKRAVPRGRPVRGKIFPLRGRMISGQPQIWIENCSPPPTRRARYGPLCGIVGYDCRLLAFRSSAAFSVKVNKRTMFVVAPGNYAVDFFLASKDLIEVTAEPGAVVEFAALGCVGPDEILPLRS